MKLIGVVFICLLFAPIALAGNGAGAIVMIFNPDAHTEGMGGAGGAMWWGGIPEPWHNPALLGYHRGLGFLSTHSQLALGLADDINLDAERLTFGYAGIGIHVQTGSLETYLDMGEQTATDEEGVEMGTFNSWMRSRGVGVGFSLGGFLRAVASDRTQLELISRHLDVAAGYMRKDFEDYLAPDWLFGESAPASVTMADYGVLGRVAVYNSLDGPGWLPDLDRALYPVISGWSLTFAGARSWLNWGDEMVVHLDEIQADPMPREYRESRSVRLALGLPGALVDALPPVAVSILTPMFAYSEVREDRWPGYIWNDDTESYDYGEDTSGLQLEQRSGREITILGFYSVRRGHVSALYGDIDGDSSGWGVGVNLSDAVRLRYDEATRPQATGLPSVELESWSVVVDALKLVELLKAEG